MQKPVILTVDDDAEVLRAIERDLKKHYEDRYRVLRADSGRAALDGFVNLGSQLTDSAHEERPIPLPRTPFPAGNHRLRRMDLSSLLSELPGC